MLARKRTVLQPHGMLTVRSSAMHRIFDALITKRLIGNATFIALTEVEAAQLEKWSPRIRGRVSVMGNPPPLELADHPASEPSITCDALFVARLHPRKRVLDFADAAARSNGNGWPETYAVVGPDEGDLPHLIARTRVTPNLEYRGATDSAGVLRELERCRVFVLSSLDEPWGNVLVSAICMGKPVVVTASSALAARIAESGAGIVVRDGDPEDIALAVHNLLDPANYASYRLAALRLAESQFSSDRVAEQLMKIYTRRKPLPVGRK